MTNINYKNILNTLKNNSTDQTGNYDMAKTRENVINKVAKICGCDQNGAVSILADAQLLTQTQGRNALNLANVVSAPLQKLTKKDWTMPMLKEKLEVTYGYSNSHDAPSWNRMGDVIAEYVVIAGIYRRAQGLTTEESPVPPEYHDVCVKSAIQLELAAVELKWHVVYLLYTRSRVLETQETAYGVQKRVKKIVASRKREGSIKWDISMEVIRRIAGDNPPKLGSRVSLQIDNALAEAMRELRNYEKKDGKQTSVLSGVVLRNEDDFEESFEGPLTK
jgi:hypothetical protein